MEDQYGTAKDASRRKAYKKGVDADDGRRRREETTIQIRKAKKQDQLAKRRAVATQPKPSEPTQDQPKTEDKVPTVAELPSIVQAIQTSNNPQVELEATRCLRRLLSTENNNEAVLAVVQSSVLGSLARFLERGDQPELLFESAWALTNVASTNATAAVVEAGAVPHLVRCFTHADAFVREQAIWCIGNIAGDSTELRDLVLKHGAMEYLLKNIEEPSHDSLLNNAVWTLSNLFRGKKPLEDPSVASAALPCLAKLLENPKNVELLIDVCWTLGYASDGDDDRITAVMEQPGLVQNLVNLLDSYNTSNVLMPVIRCLGNFVSGSELHTELVLNAGFLKYTRKILKSSKKMIKKELCWALSNIAAGTVDQVERLFTRDARLPDIVSLGRHAHWEIRKEAIWVICNIFTGGTDQHRDRLVNLDGLGTICEVLTMSDTTTTIAVLDALEKVLETGQRIPNRNYINKMESSDGLENLEVLQEHANDQIYSKVIHIIDTYIGRAEDEEDENLAPAVNGKTFEFGLNSDHLDSKRLFDDELSMDAEAQQPQQPFQQNQFGNDFGFSRA